MEPEISAVVPTYCEEAKIEEALHKISRALSETGRPFEIIVVDNASPDGTVAAASRVDAEGEITVLVNDRNRGKGHSVKRGMLEGRGHWRFFIDADLATPVEEIPRFYDLASEHDIAVLAGSRLAAGADVREPQPLLRRLMGKAFLQLSHVVARGLPEDLYCGYKWFRADAAEAVFPQVAANGWAFDLEALAIAKKLGYEIAEVPIAWQSREGSKLRMARDFPAIIVELTRIWRRLAKVSLVERRPERTARNDDHEREDIASSE